MASTDEFNFISSNSPQSVDSISPYSEKNYNNLNDINSGVYSASNTLVQFDLASIYNSSQFTDTNDAFLAIPLVMVAQYSSGPVAGPQALRVPPLNAHGLCTIKNGFHHLVHQVEIQSGGQVIQNIQPFNNVVKNFKLLSTMSATDLKQLSNSYGMADCLDSFESQKWLTVAGTASNGTTAATGTLPGIGLTNNQAYLDGTTPYSGTQKVSATQNSFSTNEALQKRISRVTSLQRSAADAATTNLQGSNIYGFGQSAGGSQPVIMTATDLAQEFKPYFTVDGNSALWYDVAVIPVKFIVDCFRSIGLSKKLDMQMRLYLNTGNLVVPMTFSTTNFVQYGAPVNSTFANTCPFTVNTIPIKAGQADGAGFRAGAADGIASTGSIAVGLYVARTPAVTIQGTGTGPVSFSFANIQGNALSACRFYYSQIKLEPSRALAYEQDNRAKLCVYEDYIFNQYNSIPAGGTFSQLVQSGIRNPLALLIVPFISPTTPTLVGGANQIGLSQFASPFDTNPATYAPISLTNLQVSLGGTNVLKSGSLLYSWETFLEQVVLADSVVAGVGPANVGIMDSKWWDQNRAYWVDLSRSNDADKASMRNLVLSFKNNSQVIIDIQAFTIFSQCITVDVTNGRTTLI